VGTGHESKYSVLRWMGCRKRDSSMTKEPPMEMWRVPVQTYFSSGFSGEGPT
jgi:hypothetical protein